MFLTDDPALDFAMYDAEQAKRLAQLPVCDCCDSPIQQDHYYHINGDNICPDCLENYYRKENDSE